MAAGTTTNLGLQTQQAGDVLPEALTKTNFETLDNYVAAKALTNKSGSLVAANSVVIVDTTTDSAFTTTAVAGTGKVAGVTQASIANGSSGIVKQFGVTSVLVTATTARGDWLTTSTTVGQALPVTATAAPSGAFALALSTTSGAGTVTALLVAGFPAASPWVKGADVASAASLNIGAVTTGQYFHVTGTTGITAITARTAGEFLILEFDGACLLTHASSFYLLGATNYTTAANDMLLFVSEGSGNWRQVSGPTTQASSPVYSAMLQLGGGALTAPSGLPAAGRVMLCDFNATAFAFSLLIDNTDNTNGYAFSPIGGLLPYTSVAPSATIAAGLSFSLASRVLTLTGSSNSATAVFGLLTGSIVGQNTVAPSAIAMLAPSRSPWMRVKMNPTAGGAASITSRVFGFFDSATVGGLATANGAYLRRNTTGNLFFVTRQGGAETAQDMGAQTGVERWYDIYSPDAGVTWKCYDQTAAVLYSSTTNVPTAGTDLIVGHAVVQAAFSQSSAFSRIAVSYVDN